MLLHATMLLDVAKQSNSECSKQQADSWTCRRWTLNLTATAIRGKQNGVADSTGIDVVAVREPVQMLSAALHCLRYCLDLMHSHDLQSSM